MPGVHKKFLDGQTGSRRRGQCFCIRDRANFPKCFNPPDIFFCSTDLTDKFFDIKECSLVPAVKDGFISGKVGEKFFVAAAVVESISDLIGVDGSGSFEFCRFRHGFDGFVKLESMIVRMVLMETIVINGLFYGMAVKAAAEVNLTEKFLYKLKRSTKGKADFIDEFAASGVEGWAVFARKPVTDCDFRDLYMDSGKFLLEICRFFFDIFAGAGISASLHQSCESCMERDKVCRIL